MKKRLILFLGLSVLLTSCSSNEEETARQTKITVNFKTYWGNKEISAADFNQFKFENELKQSISIQRLRYLVSNVQLTDGFKNVKKLSDYNLVNLGEKTGLSFTTNVVAFNGKETLTFVFGFTDKYNTSGTYQDLNTANFNVPKMMGGGYHYMQFDGKYKNTKNEEKPFNYHAIRAFKRDKNKITELKDTSFLVTLNNVKVQNNEAVINIKVDVSKWFANKWDLSKWDTPLMPNYDAQIQMNTNGKKVFSLLQ